MGTTGTICTTGTGDAYLDTTRLVKADNTTGSMGETVLDEEASMSMSFSSASEDTSILMRVALLLEGFPAACAGAAFRVRGSCSMSHLRATNLTLCLFWGSG